MLYVFECSLIEGDCHSDTGESARRDVRGEIDFSISEYQKNLKAWHIVLKEDGNINWKETQKDSLGKNMIESIKNKPEYKLYVYLLWLKKESFDEIIDAIKRLSLCVKDEIQ